MAIIYIPTLDLCNPEDGWLIVDIVGWLVNLLVAWTSRHPRLWFPTDIGPLVAVAVTLFPYLLSSNKALHFADMFWVFILDANRISRCFIDDRSHHRQWQELTKIFSRSVLSIPTACSSSQNSDKIIYISIFIHYIILYSVYIYNIFQVPEAVVANPHHHLVGESPVPASVPGHAGRLPPAEMGIETETIPECQWFTAVKRIVNLQLWLFTQPISSENGDGLAILGSLFKWLLLIWVGREESI